MSNEACKYMITTNLNAGVERRALFDELKARGFTYKDRMGFKSRKAAEYYVDTHFPDLKSKVDVEKYEDLM